MESAFILASLVRADLDHAKLVNVNLRHAILYSASLYKAVLYYSDLTDSDLSKADFNGTDISGADFTWVKFDSTNFNNAVMEDTIFTSVDFSQARGLDTIIHNGPSNIDIDTIYKSKGEIPEVFLRGVGVPDKFIEYLPHLITGKAIQFYSCFISYSTNEKEFAKCLHAELQSNGVCVWFAPKDLKIGDKFRQRIDESIKTYDKLLIVLSENSIHSPWVEKEAETAFEEERKRNNAILFPVTLDKSIWDTDQDWAADIRRVRHIGDFSNWKDQDSYKIAFDRLLRDLQAEE